MPSPEPKKRTTGRAIHACTRCGKTKGIIRKYNINVCRNCFRDIAETMGWKKYN